MVCGGSPHGCCCLGDLSVQTVLYFAVGMTWKLVKETFENAGEVAFCEITNSGTKTGESGPVGLFCAATRRYVSR